MQRQSDRAGVPGSGLREPATPGHLHPIPWRLLDPPTAIQTRGSPDIAQAHTRQDGALHLHKGALTLTCPESPQKTPVGAPVTGQLEQEGVEAQPPCGLRRKRAGGALGPQGHPWGDTRTG